MQTKYDWRERWKILMQTDIAKPPLRHDVTLVGNANEQIATLEYMYRNGYLTGTALDDATTLFDKEEGKER